MKQHKWKFKVKFILKNPKIQIKCSTWVSVISYFPSLCCLLGKHWPCFHTHSHQSCGFLLKNPQTSTSLIFDSCRFLSQWSCRHSFCYIRRETWLMVLYKNTKQKLNRYNYTFSQLLILKIKREHHKSHHFTGINKLQYKQQCR